MAHGIKHGTEWSSPKIWGNELEKEGAAWTATKWYFPMLSLRNRDDQCRPKRNRAGDSRLAEAKRGLALALRNRLGDAQDILVECAPVERNRRSAPPDRPRYSPIQEGQTYPT